MKRRPFLLLEVLLALMITAGCGAVLLASGASQARTLRKAAIDLATDWAGRELLALAGQELRLIPWHNQAKEAEVLHLQKKITPIYGKAISVQLVGTIHKIKETQTGNCYLIQLQLYQGKEKSARRTTFLFIDPKQTPLPAA